MKKRINDNVCSLIWTLALQQGECWSWRLAKALVALKWGIVLEPTLHQTLNELLFPEKWRYQTSHLSWISTESLLNATWGQNYLFGFFVLCYITGACSQTEMCVHKSPLKKNKTEWESRENVVHSSDMYIQILLDDWQTRKLLSSNASSLWLTPNS